MAATLLEAMTGGQPGRVVPLSGRLSRLQSAWLQRLATVFLTALERVRQGLELPTPQGTRVETPRRLRPPVPEALLAVAAFEVRLWGTTQPLHLALPGAALQPLATVQPRAQPEQSDPGTVRAVRRNAGRAAIPLSVQLRSVTVPLQAVMSLAPGDTVCLQRSAAEPLLLLVGGRVKWLALAGTSRGRQAVRLVAVAPPTVS
jgi:flagellar motor switch protein FliM